MDAESANKPDSGARVRRNRLAGIGLMCGALVCFAALDTTAKYLVETIDMLQIIWARFTGAFVFTVLFVNPLTRPGVITVGRPVLQLARAALLLASTFLNFIAIRSLQLDQTAAIMFSTPFFIAALAGPILGEWIGLRRWLAILVGFAGVLVVMRPGLTGFQVAMMFSLGAAICYALYNIITRLLARTDSTETTVLYSNLFGVAVTCPLLPFVWTTPSDALHIFLLIAMGAFAAFGHFLLVVAHRLAPAPVLAPFIYTQIVWLSLSGFLVFGNVPSEFTLAGAAIVIASGLYLLYRERVRGPRKAVD
jgi:drug/metabolite transporter (DMT)-like permease